ncbi:MAG: hypothetical protein V1709_07180 [Planctomycetota bacterium]
MNKKIFTILCIWMVVMVFPGCASSGHKESGSKLKAFKESPEPVGYSDDRASGGGHKDKDKGKGDKGDDHDRRVGSPSHPGEHRGWDNDGDDDILGEVVGEVIGDLVCDIALNMDFLFEDRIRYMRYPYFANDPIYQKDRDHGIGRTLAGTFRSYYIMVDNDIWAYNLNEEIKFSTGVSEEVSFTRYIEDVSHQKNNETMDCFKFYFNWLGAEDTNAVVKIGVGGEHISGIGGGVSFQSAVDFFPEKPWGLSGAASYSFLEDDVRIADFEFKVGLFRKRNEFDIGYRSLINSHGDNLNGPFVGITFWF